MSDALDLAERVADVLEAKGIRAALIGATAMAVHGYVRATQDIDLGTRDLSIAQLATIAGELRAQGMEVDVRTPDADDPLGGLIRVSDHDGNQVDVVNFGNPWTGAGRRVGEVGLAEPWVPLEGKRVAAVGLPGLVILKLAAGSRFDLRDAAELLARNPELDLAALGESAAALRLDKRLARVLADVKAPVDEESLP